MADNKMATIITLFLVMIVGLVLTPVVSDQVALAAVNETGAVLAVLNLVPLFWVFMIIGLPVGGIYITLRPPSD